MALTITRVSSAAPHSFQKVGSFDVIKNLEAKSRDGLVRVVLEVDLVQRPRGGRTDLGAFGRCALLDLLKQTKDGSAVPVLPLFGITQKWDMLTGFVDLPDGVASQMVMASGQVRGVFARPFVGGGAVHPFPTGFRLDSHRIVWAKVSRFSDVVFGALRTANANFAGLVCPRSHGEIGVRVACGSDISTIPRCLEEGMHASVKALPDGERRVTLRASDVPLALMTKLHLVVSRIDGRSPPSRV